MNRLSNNHLMRTVQMMIFALFFMPIGVVAPAAEPVEASNEAPYSVHLGIEHKTNKIKIIVQNSGKESVNCSSLAAFGNTIHIMTPSGKMITHEISEKLPKGFQYTPDYVIKPKTSKSIATDYLSAILDDLSSPGRYEVWVDIVSWTDFGKNIHKKQSSNKLIIFVPEKK